MAKETQPPEQKKQPTARFCACPREEFKPGTYVYIKSPGILTTVHAEAAELEKSPVGCIDSQGRLAFNDRGEKFLKA